MKEKLEALFRKLGRTEKVNFISSHINYASDEAIANHVNDYLADILIEVGHESIIDFLTEEGYTVTKPSE